MCIRDSKATVRSGGDYKRIEMNTAEISDDMNPEYANSILELTDCLDDFATSYPNEAKIVNLRFFAGLTMEEIAEVLGITRRTAQRHWAFARGVLGHLLSDGSV